MPFANIGGDPSHEHFVDGVTESLTTDLSRIRGSFVIGRNTAFTYKGKPVDLKQIGRDLNVRYVLEGSVQRGENRMRVNVQLIDAENGSHLWAERFDRPVADLFDMQDEIVARLAGQLGTRLVAAEARRSARALLPDSMDFYFQGMTWSEGRYERVPGAGARSPIARWRSIPAISRGGCGRRTRRRVRHRKFCSRQRARGGGRSGSEKGAVLGARARVGSRMAGTHPNWIRSALPKASPNVSARWRSIETSPKPTLISA